MSRHSPAQLTHDDAVARARNQLVLCEATEVIDQSEGSGPCIHVLLSCNTPAQTQPLKTTAFVAHIAVGQMSLLRVPPD